MLDRTILSQMLINGVLVPLELEHGKNIVKLLEPQEPNSSVIIRDIPDDAFVIKIDEFPAPQKVFNGNKSECKRADFVIISEARKCMVFLEIKKTKDSWSKIVCQLMGAECAVEYLKNIGQQFWEQSTFLAEYTKSFISIGKTGSTKKKMTLSQMPPDNNTPQTALKINHPHYVQFNRLLSKPNQNNRR